MIEWSAHFKNKHVVITGGSGFIGANLARTFVQYQSNVHIVTRKNSDLWRLRDIEDDISISELDLTDTVVVNSFMKKTKPHFLFHCATPSHTLSPDYDLLPAQLETSTRILLSIFGAFESDHILEEDA